MPTAVDSSIPTGFATVAGVQPSVQPVVQSGVQPSTQLDEPFGRRALLSAARKRFAAVATATGLAAATTPNRAEAIPSSQADVDPGALGPRLVSRITFGTTSEELALFNQMGFSGYLEYHLNHTAIPDTYIEDRFAGRIAGIPALATLTMTGEQLYALNNLQAQYNELVEAVLLRAVYSKRQLFERMVDFWSDHFNLDCQLEIIMGLKTLDDRETIRPHALGNFTDMLVASARSPAMLSYLNNDLNTAAAPNENYAREILELHSLSTAGGYTQADVIAVSRCLTGWTRYDGYAVPSNLRGTFQYNDAAHDQGVKVLSPVFNLTGTGPVVIPANQPPLKDGMDVLSILSRHPSTANFLATKLCRRFIGEDCPTPVIATVKAAYLNNGSGVVGDIKAMVRAMLTPNVLHTASLCWKRPLHLFASALRILPVTISTTGSLRSHLADAGHLPFWWGPPDGYPDTIQYWSSQQIPRWNFAVNLVPQMVPIGSGLSGIRTDIGSILAGTETLDEVMDRIDAVVFQGEMNRTERLRIRRYLSGSGFTQQSRNESVSLALASPGFQMY